MGRIEDLRANVAQWSQIADTHEAAGDRERAAGIRSGISQDLGEIEYLEATALPPEPLPEVPTEITAEQKRRIEVEMAQRTLEQAYTETIARNQPGVGARLRKEMAAEKVANDALHAAQLAKAQADLDAELAGKDLDEVIAYLTGEEPLSLLGRVKQLFSRS